LRTRARYYGSGLLHESPLSADGLGDAGGFELGVVVERSGAGLVSAPAPGPDLAEVAAGVAHRRGGQAGQAAGFGGADLDQAGIIAGGWSPAVAGSLPASRQAAGCMPPTGGSPLVRPDGTGRAAATASSAWAHMDSTVCRWKECQSRTWCWSRPACPFPDLFFGAARHRLLLGHLPMTEDFIREVVEVILDGIQRA